MVAAPLEHPWDASRAADPRYDAQRRMGCRVRTVVPGSPA